MKINLDKHIENKDSSYVFCVECQGKGKKKKRIQKKAKLRYLKELDQHEKMKGDIIAPVPPKGNSFICTNCKGTGIVFSSDSLPADNENYPHVAIIGGGIGGVALAIGLLHRGIPFTIYERDNDFNVRSQGYGLTLQQASKAIAGLGIHSLKDGVVSTRHLVHTTDGKVIGEWGMRKWLKSNPTKTLKRTNIHVARQSLRLALVEQLGGQEVIKWGHQFVEYKECEDGTVDLSFQVNGEIKKSKVDLLVGADGIRSSVRRILIGDEISPLRYLGCIVILGICPLESLEGTDSPLLDSATVFQTANGNERIYMMPYTADSVMWQLSFPMSEEEAKLLSSQGNKALKEEAIRRTQWHDPIPQIISSTLETQISGYPVYDRELLTSELLEKGQAVTLIGDAAHPMSPFKGQGANQALLDALALARALFIGCNSLSKWKENGIQKSVLTTFESEMLERSASKVKDSGDAAQFLHSEIVLHQGDETRGRYLKIANKVSRSNSWSSEGKSNRDINNKSECESEF